jgi:hypothetical protein
MQFTNGVAVAGAVDVNYHIVTLRFNLGFADAEHLSDLGIGGSC